MFGMPNIRGLRAGIRVRLSCPAWSWEWRSS